MKLSVFFAVSFLVSSAFAQSPDDYLHNLNAELLYNQDIVASDVFNQLSIEEQDKLLVERFLAKKDAAYRGPCWNRWNAEQPAMTVQAAVVTGLSYVVSTILTRNPANNLGQGIAAATVLTAGLSNFFTTVATSGKEAYKCQYDERPHDPIEKLEIDYVKKKRLMDLSLQKRVESELTVNCRHEFAKNSCIEVVKNALQLPTHVKKISFDNAKADTLLQGIDDRVVKGIKRYCQKQVLFQPADDQGQRQARKNIIYFKGLPGTGKTRAAKLVAQILDLPHQVIAIKSEGGTKPEDILGSFSFYEAKPGLIVTALTTKAPGADSAVKNVVFILDDGDRAINGKKDANGKASANPIADLVRQLLDPETKTIDSPYFGLKLDISNVIIILTGNEEIDDESIRNRIEILEFPALTKEQKVRYVISEFVPMYLSLLPEQTRNKARLSDEDIATIEALVENDSDPGMRSIQTTIENMLVDKITAEG